MQNFITYFIATKIRLKVERQNQDKAENTKFVKDLAMLNLHATISTPIFKKRYI